MNLFLRRLAGPAAVIAGLAAAGTGELRAEPAIGAVFQRPYLGAIGTRIDGTSEKLYFNTTVFAEETVHTGARAGTALRFADGTKLQVGANSTVVLDRFVYDPDGGAAEGVIRFSTGIFRFISGKMPKDALRLETPSATLAIRGTKFVLAVDDQGATDVWVIEGSVEAIPETGDPATAQAGQSLVIEPGRPGVTLVNGRTAPHDPAVEDDLSFFGPPGIGDRERRSGMTGDGNRGGNNN